jgi:uncharacterized membrane-anchored protein
MLRLFSVRLTFPEDVNMRRYCFVALVLAGFVSSTAHAQEPAREGWTPGPTAGRLGEQATVNVPEGYVFLDAKATRKFLVEGQNIPAGDELGAIFRPLPNDDYWFAVFSYDETGHVDDSDKNGIDADALMKSMKEGNRRGNVEREKRGWETLDLDGWQQKPYYDLSTHNLTWSTIVSSGGGSKAVNHSVRLLGRTGTMSVQLVSGQDAIDAATLEFNDVLRGYSYNSGKRYAEFTKGDKLAGYGLTALIAGGAGAAAVKSGLLQKFWKLIVFAVVAVGAAAKKFLAALFGKKDEEATAPGAVS